MKKILQISMVKYIAVGLTSLVVDYGLLMLLFHVFNLPLPFATTVAFLAGLVVNFLLNKYWSFQAAGGLRQTTKQAVLYGLLVGFNLLFTNAFILYLHDANIGPEISKPISTAIITLWNYLLYKSLIFRVVIEEDDEK